ncbi:hypothetical protein QF021_003609 [Acidovorax delafieldii]|nr:TniQ family protein [Acidovorax delafieldii]MDR6155520.1 hypothetical protein [Acidovorax delafieldii]
MYAAAARSGRFANFNSACRAVTGLSPPSAYHLHTGFRSEDFCRVVLDDAITASELLHRHTLFPLLSRILGDEAKKKWHRNLIFGSPAIQKGFARIFACQYLISKEWRICPECATEDLAAHGYVYTRLPHQLKSEKHCTNHGVVLMQGCTCPLDANDWSTLERCPSCRDTIYPINDFEYEVNSQTRRIFNGILRSALTEDSPHLHPRTRNRAMRSLCEKYRVDPSGLLKKFCAWLKIRDFSDLSKLLGIRVTERNLHSFFTRGAADNFNLLLISSSFAWQQISPAAKNELNHNSAEPVHHNVPTTNATSNRSSFITEVQRLAEYFQLHPNFPNAVFTGDIHLAIAMAGRYDVFNFIQSLSLESRTYMSIEPRLQSLVINY